jgi:hypothetical protein
MMLEVKIPQVNGITQHRDWNDIDAWAISITRALKAVPRPQQLPEAEAG